MSVTDILVDFAIASFFIAVGQLLRAKVPLVQKFFIPPSMIAGFIALALGAQGLGILPFSENIFPPACDWRCDIKLWKGFSSGFAS